VDINQLIAQHGKSVALVFKNMGIGAEVANKDLMLALVMYKEPLMDAIAAQVAIDTNYTNLGGDEPIGQMAQVKTLGNVTVAAKKKSTKVKDTLMGIFTTLVTGAGAYVGAKNKAQATTYSNTIAPAVVTPEKEKKQKYFLIGGIAVIVVLVIVLLTQKNK
jgi:hypothetical protein